MSETVDKPTWGGFLRGLARVVAICFLITLVVSVVPQIAVIFFGLTFGWIAFLFETIPQISFDPIAVVSGLLSITISIELLHRMMIWYIKARDWDVAWHRGKATIAIGMIGVLFAAGIAAIGITHQSIWLAREPMFDRSWMDKARTRANMQNLMNLIEVYYVDQESLPSTSAWQEGLLDISVKKDDGWAHDAWNMPIRYSVFSANQFELRSSGPDMVMDTEDDIFLTREL